MDERGTGSDSGAGVGSESELVVVSGYYGFDNMGDEAILESLLSDLDKVVGLERVVVLSNSPEATSATYGVKSVNRWKIGEIAPLLMKSKALVSGGGGLFQDSSSIKSVFYYAGLNRLAAGLGLSLIVYAQGVGPLKSGISKNLTKMAFEKAKGITVRDRDSLELLSGWGLTAELTADPVWGLRGTALPEPMDALLKQTAKSASIRETRDEKSASTDAKETEVTSTPGLVGLSLRPSPHLSEQLLDSIIQSLCSQLPRGCTVVPLVLHEGDDDITIGRATDALRRAGFSILELPGMADLRPSQWLTLIGGLDFVVGMRFHAVLMAVSQGVPCLGLAYDPKVAYLMRNSQQPFLNLANSSGDELQSDNVEAVVKHSLEGLSKRSEDAMAWAEHSKMLACKNFALLDRILSNKSSD